MTYPLATKEAILAAPDLVYEEIDVPEWKLRVRVRGMTGTARDAWEIAQIDGTRADIRATLLAYSIVDADGKLLFTPEDITDLGAKSARALQRVFRVARTLSRVSEEDVKELEKNSNGAPGDTSPSSSPKS